MQQACADLGVFWKNITYTKIFFSDVVKKFEEKWLIIKTWTIVDAIIIKSPSSTKNASKKRDPKMKSVLTKYDERYIENSENMIMLCFIRLLSKRLSNI